MEILAFPCNQFGAQEPACEIDIKNFATNNYQADYQLFSKIDVNGAGTHPLYQYLRSNSTLADAEGEGVGAITWNFEKFLVDANGNVLKNFHPKVAPNDIVTDIEPLLA